MRVSLAYTLFFYIYHKIHIKRLQLAFSIIIIIIIIIILGV